MGITEAQIRDWDAGKVELRELIGMSTDYVEQLRGRAQFFLEGGHDERALIMLEMLEELDRTDKLPALLAVEVLLREGHSDRAEEKIEALKARFPGDPEVVVAEAELKIAIGEMVPAAELLQSVVEGDPQGKTGVGQRALAVAAAAHRKLEGG